MTAQAQRSGALSDLLARAGQYSAGLQENLGVVIADEDYTQDVWSRTARLRASTGRILSRKIRSEMLFVQLPQQDIWLTIRNVLAVDGKSVPENKERLERALREPGFGYVARLRTIDAENARYDIGHVWRTTGYPTLALRFVTPSYQARFAFTLAGQERLSGEAFEKVKYYELGVPSVIQVNESDVTSAGMMWIRQSDGTIGKTSVDFKTPAGMSISITTEFAKDIKLGLWLPRRMQERYDELSGDSTTCLASYSNFRRFETSGRLIVQ